MAKKAKPRGVISYKSYMFREKDPVIDELRTIMTDTYEAGVSYSAFAQTQEAGGPAATTMANWFFGATKRPQSATVEAAGRAMGKKRVWVDMKGSK